MNITLPAAHQEAIFDAFGCDHSIKAMK